MMRLERQARRVRRVSDAALQDELGESAEEHYGSTGRRGPPLMARKRKKPTIHRWYRQPPEEGS